MKRMPITVLRENLTSVLSNLRISPVEVTKHHRVIAVLIEKADFEGLVDLLNEPAFDVIAFARLLYDSNATFSEWVFDLGRQAYVNALETEYEVLPGEEGHDGQLAA